MNKNRRGFMALLGASCAILPGAAVASVARTPRVENEWDGFKVGDKMYRLGWDSGLERLNDGHIIRSLLFRVEEYEIIKLIKETSFDGKVTEDQYYLWAARKEYAGKFLVSKNCFKTIKEAEEANKKKMEDLREYQCYEDCKFVYGGVNKK